MITEDELREILRQQCNELGNAAIWSRNNKVSNSYISDILSGRRPIGKKVASRLGMEAVKLYKKINED